jgi:polyhydroxyalkanoate synthase
LPWPLTILDDSLSEATRIWSPFSRLDVRQPETPAQNKRAASAQAPENVEATPSVDRLFHAIMGRFTLGVSPASLWLAYADWAIHLCASPGKCQQLMQKSAQTAIRFQIYLSHLGSGKASPPCIEPLPQDSRFRNEAWQRLPFNLIYQTFLLHQEWWHDATTGIRGVSPHHEQLVSFMGRQALDTFSPSNFIATNPEVLAETIREGGQNLCRGAMNLLDDWEREMGSAPPAGTDDFQPGKQVAITKGKVVYRNSLIELIQYAPTTVEVHTEPVLIVPAWIMKYYILDLSPGNSLVKYLVDHGYTVFMISWHNPTAGDRDLGMDDYLRLGVLDAVKAVQRIVPDARINALGYCLGGTLLAIAAAYLACESPALNTVTLLAAQTDFTEAGELMLFIDDSQVGFLEDIMWEQGYLKADQMAGTFQFLRSSDLIWSRLMHEYLMGQRSPLIDLMAWNADTTRMPYRMHSEYLCRLYLHNDLFEGRYRADGKSIALGDIQVPMFAVSTETDHVAPWRSVYKLNLAVDSGLTFVLTSGGHNAGIVSEPGHKGRHYRISHRAPDAQYVDPETWYAQTKVEEGSWWPAWLSWLDQQSRGRTSPPAIGAPGKGYGPLEDAPGRYVLER